jgi:hypothetical protein
VSEASIGVGVLNKTTDVGMLPPPDHRFAMATLPTLSRGRDMKDVKANGEQTRCAED